MKKLRICLWTGGQPFIGEKCQSRVDTLPNLPDPLPLCRAILVEYWWGATKFDIVATACSLRTTAWGEEQVTWLHCKAMQTAAVKPDQPTSLMNVLIPADYVTNIKPGPTFHPRRGRPMEDLGVFPPVYTLPAHSLPLETIERVVTELLAPERN